MKGLSRRTWQLIRILFKPEQQEAAGQMLAEECGQNLPFLKDLDEFKLERYRFAALKISAGNLSMLRKAVDQAKKDWRDLLMWADFGYTLTAHDEWAQQILVEHT